MRSSRTALKLARGFVLCVEITQGAADQIAGQTDEQRVNGEDLPQVEDQHQDRTGCCGDQDPYWRDFAGQQDRTHERNKDDGDTQTHGHKGERQDHLAQGPQATYSCSGEQ